MRIERLESRDLLSLIVNNVTTTEGVPLNNFEIASFSQSDLSGTQPSDFTATINWGDGHITTGNVTAGGPGYEVFGSNTYLTPSTATTPFTITVSVTNQAPTTISAPGSANVANAALTSTPVGIAPTKGAVFTGLVAGFMDANTFVTPGNFSATINWGDG